MRNLINKKGYTIAEIMIVMLILTIIFAAFAPLITKRRVTTNRSKYAVWNPMNQEREFNAYYDPNDSSYSGSLFAGLTPDGQGAIKSTLAPIARLVIRSGAVTSSNKLQRQIQFRFGRSGTAEQKKFGKYAGTWLMDRQNVLLGGSYLNLQNIPNNIEARDNVAIGYQSLTQLRTSTGNSALGAYALMKNASGKYNVAVGYNAGAGITTGNNNTFVGSGAGEKHNGKYNTAVGYHSMATSAGSGDNNTFIGAWAGDNTSGGSKNVGIGYRAMGNSQTTGNYNIAVGAHALEKLTSGSYNVAIGYKACMHVSSGSYKTCIGANSGPATDRNSLSASETTGTKSTYIDGRTDNVQRTYIGSRPYNFGGDAVLEIHNIDGTNSKLANSPKVKSNTTTVINGNLIVRGRSYFTVGNELWNFAEVNPKDLFGSSFVSGEDLENAYGYYGSDTSDYKVNTDQQSYNMGKGLSLTSDYSSSSDRRLKNIGTRNLAGLKEINKLNIYNYTFKNDKDKLPHVGVMAQELQKVFPNSVTKGEDGYLRIRWDEMFFASINAIKELDRKIVALINRTIKVESQIAKLETENATLKSQVSALTARVERLKK